MDDDKFKKIIESCHLNFLIGSGASRNFFNTLGNVENLLTELLKFPKSDSRDIVEASIKKDYFTKGIKGNVDILDEQLVSEMELVKTRENYHDFLSAVNIILLRRRSTLIGKQANLFTTNMDILLDKSLEELNLEYNDGFSGKLNPVFSTSNYRKSIFQKSPHYENKAELPLFNLFKLHGSVTWSANNDKIVFDKNLDILKRISDISVEGKLIESFEDSEKKAKGIDSLLNEAEFITKDDSVTKFLSAYDEMVIINPTKEKFSTTTTQYTFYELLRMYSNELEKENSVLFVFGFSFADEHIREITKRVANSNPTLLICVFAYDDSAKKDIENKLNLGEFKFGNISVLVAGDLAALNSTRFSSLARDLDDSQFAKKTNDIIVNVSIPPKDN
ncbi:SIR2 family protein [Pedobacter nyackensis]|uniref:SIR2-like domain-containing protein n=1 Tax=Pedobacter nyackensis TaxID=475255 RepID=A0A1W2AIJ3_9SPHI|nr:SIR2 family protein [Pedobacter nyackensis]SMC60380.1 SIR2-like domain-containing protein [Pedobacter nyackensis]